MSSEATVYVNDKPRALKAGATVHALLQELGLDQNKGLAVAVNGAIARRRDWQDCRLAAEDRVLIIQATQGG